MRRPVLVLALAVQLCARSVGVARAADARPPLTLDWNATPECSSGPGVLDDVAHILAGASGVNRRVTARARLVRTDRGAWAVFLATETDGGPRSRWFDAESCEAAADGVAFILALAVNPAGVKTPAPATPLSTTASLFMEQPDAGPASAPATTTDATQAAEAVAPAVAPRTAKAPPASSTVAGVPSERASELPVAPKARTFPAVLFVEAASADAGTLPRPTLGVSAAIGLQPQSARWRIELAGSYWTPQSETGAAGAAGAQFHAFSAEARMAYGWPLGPFVSGPLAGVGIESIAASGFGGSAANFSGSLLIGTLGGGAFASWRGHPELGLHLEVEGEVPFTRPSFVVYEPAPLPNSLVFRLPPVAARALLGAELSF